MRSLFSSLRASIARRRFDIDTGGSVYLCRWRLIQTALLRVYVHQIVRDDWARDCHDHPWSFISIILAGGYFECTPVRPGSPFTSRRWYRPGRVLVRPGTWTHRIELPPGRSAWSLVIAGPRWRDWGFHTPAGWCWWKHYIERSQSHV